MSSDSATPEIEQGAPSPTGLTITPASFTTVSFPITEHMARLIEESTEGLFYEVAPEHRAEWLLCCALADRIKTTDPTMLAIELHRLGWQTQPNSVLDMLVTTDPIGHQEPLWVKLRRNTVLWVPPSLLFGLTGTGI